MSAGSCQCSVQISSSITMPITVCHYWATIGGRILCLFDPGRLPCPEPIILDVEGGLGSWIFLWVREPSSLSRTRSRGLILLDSTRFGLESGAWGLLFIRGERCWNSVAESRSDRLELWEVLLVVRACWPGMIGTCGMLDELALLLMSASLSLSKSCWLLAVRGVIRGYLVTQMFVSSC